jgi:hypothetical protein
LAPFAHGINANGQANAAESPNFQTHPMAAPEHAEPSLLWEYINDANKHASEKLKKTTTPILSATLTPAAADGKNSPGE